MNDEVLLDGNIAWFRQASPYIKAHRGKTIVLYVSGEGIESRGFPTLIHDISLLNSLGIRLVLVFGLRPQIDASLTAAGRKPIVIDGLRVTDDDALVAVKNAVGQTRIEIEALLSMGLPNTPMSGSHLSVASGNFVIAQPFGIHEGNDYYHTGIVRQIQVDTINNQLQQGHVVLIPPLGYSMTGEVFNLQSEDIARHVAVALGAEKLVYMLNKPVCGDEGQPLLECSSSEVRTLLNDRTDYLTEQQQRVLQQSLQACDHGVDRVHLLSHHNSDALLKELFTRDGGGMLVTSEDYDTIRPARIRDVGGIIELIQPLEDNGTLVRRTREQLELDIDHFVVCEREGMITACAALQDSCNAMAEIACVVTHPQYQKMGRAEKLLKHLEGIALGRGDKALYVLTTRTGHWFIEQGFTLAETTSLPVSRQQQLDQKRNSKVLVKQLSR